MFLRRLFCKSAPPRRDDATNLLDRMTACLAARMELERQQIEKSRSQRMRVRFPIGSRFSYLGREMRVSAHAHAGGYVALRVEYSDNNGVIRFHQFSWPEVEALMQEHP